MSQLPLWYPGFVRNMYTLFGLGQIRICPEYALTYRTEHAAASRPEPRPQAQHSRPHEAGQIHTRLDPERPARSRNGSAIDKALQRLVLAGDIRRVDRGLYDVPRINSLTGKPNSPDYTAIIDAVARREKARFLPDGITAASQLGLTDAVPAKVTVHTDARLRPIHLDSLVINFKPTAPSRLYWAGRPGDANRPGASLATRYASRGWPFNPQTNQENSGRPKTRSGDSQRSSERSRFTTRVDARSGDRTSSRRGPLKCDHT